MAGRCVGGTSAMGVAAGPSGSTVGSLLITNCAGCSTGGAAAGRRVVGGGAVDVSASSIGGLGGAAARCAACSCRCPDTASLMAPVTDAVCKDGTLEGAAASRGISIGATAARHCDGGACS